MTVLPSGAMSSYPKWQDVRADVVANAGGEEAIAEARLRNQASIDGYRLAERRKCSGSNARSCHPPDGPGS
jgi:hypothetical protein